MNIPNSLIVVIIILFAWHWTFTYNHPDLETEKLAELILNKKFKTGDLILFKATNNWHASGIASYYTHVGVVWVYPDDPHHSILLNLLHA